MAVTQTSAITVLFDAVQTNALDLSNVSDRLIKSYLTSLASGTGSGQANTIWHDQRTLAASGTEDLDLAGVLTSTISGATLTFTKIKLIFIYADPANVNNVVVSRPASNGLVLFSAAADACSVLPGGIFMLTAPQAGIAVTAATGDLLTITNSAGTTGVNYDVIIAGVA